jgi:UMF1 family MFS transporter
MMNKVLFIKLFSVLLAIFSFAIPGLYLAGATGGFVVGIAMLGLFVLINYSYQMSLLFYNAMLGDISEKSQLMKISSFGVAAGWVGAIVGILLIMPVAGGSFGPNISGPVYALLMAGLLFTVVVAIPLSILKDNPIHESASNSSTNVPNIIAFFREVFANKVIWFFLLGYWLYIDAILTVQENLTLYMENVFHVPDDQKAVAALILISGGIIGALASIKLVDIENPKRKLMAMIIVSGCVMFGLGLAPSFAIFLITLFLLALVLGALLTTSRAVYTSLVPAEKRSSYFSYYAIAERSGSIIGPLIWGGIVSFSSFGNPYQLAMVAMGAISLVALVFIRKM